MDLSWSAPFVKWLVGGILMALVTGWLARGRFRSAPRTHRGTELTYPRSVLLLGLVSVAFFAACTYLSLPAKTGGPLVASVFVAFAALGTYLVAECLATRHAVRPDGLEYRTLLARRGFARWDEIEAVRYSPSMKWFVVGLRRGRSVRFSALLIGLPEFAQALRARVPPDVIAPETAALLDETAAGRPPSVW